MTQSSSLTLLTKKQRMVHDYIKRYTERHQISPTLGEIATEIGIKSRGVAHRYVQALIDAGLIDKVSHRKRNLVCKEQQSNYSLPLMGTIAAGLPIEAVPDAQTIDFVERFLGEGRYALRVRGDSMINEGIQDGDLVICESVSRASSGQIVVALVDNESATLKRIFYRDNQMIELRAANPAFQPQLYPEDRVIVQGIFIGLLRLPNT